MDTMHHIDRSKELLYLTQENTKPKTYKRRKENRNGYLYENQKNPC